MFRNQTVVFNDDDGKCSGDATINNLKQDILVACFIKQGMCFRIIFNVWSNGVIYRMKKASSTFSFVKLTLIPDAIYKIDGNGIRVEKRNLLLCSLNSPLYSNLMGYLCFQRLDLGHPFKTFERGRWK